MDYQTLRQAIIDWTEEDGVELAAHIDDFIKAAELRIFREVDLEIFRTHLRALLDIGNPYVTMPVGSDIIVRDLFIVDPSNRRRELLRKHASFLRDFWPDNTETEQPRYYARWLYNVLVVAPTPDFPYPIEMECSQLPASIVPTSPVGSPPGPTNATSWLGDNAWDALLAGAMLEALAFMKAESEAVMPVGNQPSGVWPQKYQEAIARLGVQEKRERLDDFRAQDPK